MLYGLLPLGVHLGVEEGGVALDDLGANHLHGGGHEAVLLSELLGQDDELAHGLGAAVEPEVYTMEHRSVFLTESMRSSSSSSETVAKLKAGQWVIGMLGSFTDADYVAALEKAGLVGIAIEKLPRKLSSAQSMDEMTSQNSVMGYKAAITAADAYGSFLPMMTTAAGTIRPAKALVLGAGIAGLQAIGTLKRLGAVVTAYDVRPASLGEVESLGAKFLDLGLDFSKGQGEGGYARALSAEEQAQQQAAVDEKAAGFDIIITTAKVPGRKPPVLLTAAGVKGLKRGAVIVDCAASDLGGNVEGSAVGEQVTEGGVKLIGAPYLASGVATTASNLLSRNVADILVHFVRDGKLGQDLTEELDDALVVAGRAAAPAAAADAAYVRRELHPRHRHRRRCDRGS